ncbi:MAG: sorbosone dehydrogenase family protein [Gemmatimonadetes bacterium]|nr:sorbosone dehydrogenase family protein [Gemmatimonadota bacterium]
MAAACGTTPAPGTGNPETDPFLSRIRLPEGFRIAVYARGVENARAMAMGPGGTLFVGSRRAGNVYAVRDRDGDFAADEVIVLDRGLRMPSGVAFRDGALYVAEVSRVLRYDDIENRLEDPPEPVVVNAGFPSDRHHGWKFIRFGPDGKLYVPVGAPCNVCERSDPRYATIMRMNPDGSDLEVYVSGVRNTVGFDWHPATGELWFTDNGRDLMGNDIPADELNRVTEPGQHFGFPYHHGIGVPDPEYGGKRPLDSMVAPAQELGPHVAAVGMRFYTGGMFPSEYRHQVFIAEHGSWNRDSKIGYRITLVRLDGNDAVGYEDFAAGWLEDEEVYGRPADVEVMPDGSLLVSDDYAGMIYRITHDN